jgi:guanosine-3',5'-bis(diphosphate) 3'-pyrophosphohydrolase
MELAYAVLEQKVSNYITEKNHLKLIKDAFLYARDSHGDQTRASGEPYIIHPIDVAVILSEYHADYITIMAGLLHDTIEDTNATFEDLEQRFGNEVATLVEAVTKLQQYKFDAFNGKMTQASTFQKMLLAMAKDIRVVLVKLADRLNNIRTLHYLPEEKQVRIAKETLGIYAPLAHRLGMYQIKAELEDTSFKYIEPDVYSSIAKMIADTKTARERDVDAMKKEIKSLLVNQHIQCEIKGRIKNIYSVHKKMTNRDKSFKEIYDLLALRVIVDTVEQCYSTIGVIHSKWIPLPNRFKDYIAMPKPNLYRSLHTSVITGGKTYEIQIRTQEMDEIAEYGVAAHFAYKEKGSKLTQEVSKSLKWYNDLIQFTEDDETKQDVYSLVTEDMFNSNIYVFTPDGDIVDLPNGATPIDFAFRIHTQVGLSTIGAIVNDKIVPLDYELQTGDICKLRTSKNSAGPNENWLKIVVTSNAKSKIRNHLNKQKRDLLIELGLADFEKELNRRNISVKMTDKIVESLFSAKGAKSIDDLYYEIGKNNISPVNAVNLLGGSENHVTEDDIIKKINERETKAPKGDKNIFVEGLDNPSIKLSNCCNPIPGDEILGYISKGQGIAVHRVTCPNLDNLDSNRYIDVFWGDDQTNEYTVHLEVSTSNRDHLLADLINAVISAKSKVMQVNARVNDTLDASVTLIVTVKNLQQLNQLNANLKRVEGVFSIEREYK